MWCWIFMKGPLLQIHTTKTYTIYTWLAYEPCQTASNKMHICHQKASAPHTHTHTHAQYSTYNIISVYLYLIYNPFISCFLFSCTLSVSVSLDFFPWLKFFYFCCYCCCCCFFNMGDSHLNCCHSCIPKSILFVCLFRSIFLYIHRVSSPLTHPFNIISRTLIAISMFINMKYKFMLATSNFHRDIETMWKRTLAL